MGIEQFAITEKTTLVLERLADGKIRATSNSFVDEKVILPDQVLEAQRTDANWPECDIVSVVIWFHEMLS
jgi:hypothetical protein